jgi:hypothetical protein
LGGAVRRLSQPPSLAAVRGRGANHDLPRSPGPGNVAARFVGDATGLAGTREETERMSSQKILVAQGGERAAVDGSSAGVAPFVARLLLVMSGDAHAFARSAPAVVAPQPAGP